MNFFKKLFSSGKKEQEPQGKTEFKGIRSEEYFNQRYTEDEISAEMLDGCLKMVSSYYADNNIAPKVPGTINDPKNLDQVVTEGLGFHTYCKAFGMEDQQTVLFLAFAFADYLIKNYGFKLYADSQPEYPLRGMTIMYNKNGMALSLYPFEYAMKVLEQQATFDSFHQKIASQLEQMPEVDDVLKGFMPDKE